MKVCPFCEAELRDSVIRCTVCARSLLERPAPVTVPPSGFGPPAAGTEPPRIDAPSEPVPAETRPAPPAAAPSPWVTPSTRASGPTASSIPDALDRRALPTRSQGVRPDWAMLASALVTGAAAYLAWPTIAKPWVTLRISDTSDGGLGPLGTATLGADAALVGTLAQAVVLIVGALALLWLIFGIDRGWTMPWFSSPSIGLVTSLAAVGGAFLTSVLWFVWRDAAVARSRAFGLSAERLTAILDNPNHAPSVELYRLPELTRFGGLMAIALLGSCAAWWAFRKRG